MSEVSALEYQRNGMAKLIEQRDAAIRLSKNRDFKTLILEGFMVEEAARYVHASADPMLPPNERADALALAQASGHLKRYLSVVTRMGDDAASQLPHIDEAIEEERTMVDE